MLRNGHEEAEYDVPRTESRLLTVEEVAARLALSPRTVRRHIASGEIPAIKLGTGLRSPIRISADELERWLFAAPDDLNEED